MISATPWLAAAASILVCIAWACLLLPTHRVSSTKNLLAIAIVVAIVLLPFSDYPAWYYVRGLFGDSSLTALAFYAAFIVKQQFGWSLYQERELLLLRSLLPAAAILLYPLSLGLIQFDSYGMGYSNSFFLISLFVMTILFWARGYNFLALIITAGVIGFSFRVLESSNLWDYLIDPMFVIFVLLTWFRALVCRGRATTSVPSRKTARV